MMGKAEKRVIGKEMGFSFLMAKNLVKMNSELIYTDSKKF